MKKVFFLILLMPIIALGTLGDQELSVDGAKLIWNNNSQTFSLAASGSMSASVNYIWPPADATSDGQALLSNSSAVLRWGVPTTSASHNILSGTHDATANAVTRGSLIYGNSTPKWDELTVGSTIGSALTKILGTDGTDSGFRTIANFALDIDSNLDHGNLESSSLDDADHNASYYTETEIGSVNSSTSGSTLMGMATISGSTFSTVQHLQNLFHSTGWVNGGVVSDNGNDTVAVTAGTGTIKASVGTTQQILFFDWSLNNSLSVPANTTRYVGVEYNAGSPQLVVRTSDNFNNDTDFILASLINESSVIHIQKEEHAVGDHSNNMIQRLFDTAPFARDNRSGGLILGESGDNNRNLTMTAGTIWEKLNQFSISAIDTSAGGGDTFDRYLTDGAGGHTKESAQTTWNNTQFDSSGTLTTLGNNKFAVQWYYIELDGEFVSMYGTTQYNTEAEAETEAPPTDIPDRISLHGKLIGRIIFQKSDTVPQSVESVFTQTFTAAGVTDHGNLAGLSNDDHTQYILSDGTRALSGNWDAGSFDIRTQTVTPDSLTSGRVTFASTNGLLVDDADMTFSTDRLTVTGATITGCSVLGLNSAVFQPTTDSTTFGQWLDAAGASILNLDSTNRQVTIGKTSATYPFIIYSTDASEQIKIYHNNKNANIKWTDGVLLLETDEGTNSQASVLVRGKGTGIGSFEIYDEDNAEYLRATCMGGTGLLFVAGSSPVKLSFQAGADAPIYMFANAIEGETQELQIFGHRTSDVARNLQIGVGVDAADTASFDGLGSYLFGGKLITLNDTHEDTDDGGETSWTGKRQDGAGTETAAGMIEISHDGAGANDQLGKMVGFVNTGAGLVEGWRLDSSLGWTFAGALAGAWDMGSQALTNVNIDSGVITGITDLAIADGGTSQSTAQAAIDALSAVSGATNEHVLTKDTGTGNAVWKVTTAVGGDEKVGIDAAAASDYIGAANSDGVLRTGNSMSYADGGNFITLDAIQDIRTSATPTWAGIIIADGGTIGQAAGPLLTFDDTGNTLTISGCDVGIGITPTKKFQVNVGTDLNVRFESFGSEMTIQAVNDAASVNIPLRIYATELNLMGGNVGIGTLSPAASAALDITSTTGALLVPRMTTTQRNALTPVDGMIFYNTTTGKFEGREGGAWANIIP